MADQEEMPVPYRDVHTLDSRLKEMEEADLAAFAEAVGPGAA